MFNVKFQRLRSSPPPRPTPCHRLAPRLACWLFTPVLCGSLLTWTRQRPGARAGVRVPPGLGSSHTFDPCVSKAFKTLSGSSKWTHYPHPPPPRLTQAVYVSVTAAYEGEQTESLWCCKSWHQTFKLLMWTTGLGLVSSVSHSPTFFADKETFKYLDQFFFFFLFARKSQFLTGKVLFNTSPKLQHDKSLAVSLLRYESYRTRICFQSLHLCDENTE